jgi:hypothetical protein
LIAILDDSLVGRIWFDMSNLSLLDRIIRESLDCRLDISADGIVRKFEYWNCLRAVGDDEYPTGVDIIFRDELPERGPAARFNTGSLDFVCARAPFRSVRLRPRCRHLFVQGSIAQGCINVVTTVSEAISG